MSDKDGLEVCPRNDFNTKTKEDAYGNDIWGGKGVNPDYVIFLEEHYSPEPKPDWVSVEDRLPMEADEGDSAYKCIVAYRSGNFSGTSVSWFEFSDEFNVGGFSGDITHWMELPEPPKTRSEG